MYPLAVLLPVAIITRSRLASRYIVALVRNGLSDLHLPLPAPTIPRSSTGVQQDRSCSCPAKFVDEFWCVPILFMAGAGFPTILLLQAGEWRVEYLFRHDRPRSSSHCRRVTLGPARRPSVSVAWLPSHAPRAGARSAR